MTRVAVAGVTNVQISRQCQDFPIPFASHTTARNGISIRLSGTGWTICRTLQRLGTDVTFATYVGTDELGQYAATGLRRHRLYGPTTRRCPTQPRAIVLYDHTGRRANAVDLRSTPDLRYPTPVFTTAVDTGPPCDAAVLTNIGFTRSLIPAMVERGIPIATDLHLVNAVDSTHNRDWMAVAHVLACSHEALPTSPTDWVRAMWRRYRTELVLIGCGGNGALLGVRATHRIWHIRATVPRPVRYTCGAGDTLLAAFLHHHLTTGDPVTAARHAVLAASWKVGGHPDDEPGVPRNRLRRLVANTGLPAATHLR